MSPYIHRRRLLQLAGTLAVAAVAGSSARLAQASLLPDPDPVVSFDQAWRGVVVTNNEGGGLAWGMSYTLLSLLRMYQATGAEKYLDRFVDLAEQVWQQTDVRRGVTDWRGESGCVWRAAGNYTAAAATITDADGSPLFEVRYASTGGATAAVSVATVTDEHFDVVLEHPVTGTVRLSGVTLDEASSDDVVSRINAEAYQPNVRWTAKRLGDGREPELGVHSLLPRHHVFAVHTGMITYPMAMFVRMVRQHGLTQHRRRAGRWLPLLRQAVAYHEDEWQPRQLPDGREAGDYVWAKGTPVAFDGLIQPFNMTHGLGQTIAELHRVVPDPRYAARVRAMVVGWDADAPLLAAARMWRYWGTYAPTHQGYQASDGLSEYTPSFPAYQPYEDLSHAAITVEFLVAAHRAGLLDADVDLATVAATYRDRLKAGDDAVFGNFARIAVAAPSVAAQAGRWLPITPWGADLPAHVRSVYEASSLDPVPGSYLLGVAYVAWAEHQGWRLD